MKYFILGFLFIAFISTVMADDHTRPYDAHYEATTNQITIIQRVEESTPGLALTMSHGQLQFDKNIKGWQAGIGVGQFDSHTAVSFGAAKQIGEKKILNFSIGREGNKTGLGIGFNWSL